MIDLLKTIIHFALLSIGFTTILFIIFVFYVVIVDSVQSVRKKRKSAKFEHQLERFLNEHEID